MDDIVVTDAYLVKTALNQQPPAEEQEESNVVEDATNQLSDVQTSARDFLNDEVEYPRDETDGGLVVIFNELFKDMSLERKGSERDVESLCQSLRLLNYSIDEKNVFKDKNKDEIVDAIKRIIEEDHSQSNCVIVAFFTHGGADDKLLTVRPEDDLRVHDIWKPFVESKKFENKPKMFIFQACKGKEIGMLQNDEKETFSLVPNNVFTSNFPPDMLIVYSTVEDNVSFRGEISGSWFVQELCRNFNKYGSSEDVISLITSTSSCVSWRYHTDKQSSINKQMPLFVSTLKKKFYLTKSDHRLVLAIKEYPDELMNRLDALSE